MKLNNKSLSILILPFITNFYVMEKSIFGSILILIFFLIIDVFVYKKIKGFIANILVFSGLFIFSYVFIAYYDTYQLIHNLRFSYFLSFFSVFTILISSIIFHKKQFKEFNIFLIFFSITFLLKPTSNIFNKDEVLTELNFKYDLEKKINLKDFNNGLIFIILDELASDKEIYNYRKDSLDLLSTNNFKKLGYEVYDDFQSISLSTKFSLPSLLNYNLHNSNNELMDIDKIENNRATVKKYDFLYKNSLLVDSLVNKDVKVINYGLATMENAQNKGSIYPWSPRRTINRNFEIIKNYKLLNRILNYTILKNFYLKYKFDEYEVYLDHNDEVWDSLSSEEYFDNSFYYFHLLAPHEPYFFDRSSNINFSHKSSIENYIKYRKEVLNKLINIISKEKFRDFRVIITSDHGYRKESEIIDPSSTMLFLKGFDTNKYPSSVQDIGYLINSSFK